MYVEISKGNEKKFLLPARDCEEIIINLTKYDYEKIKHMFRFENSFIQDIAKEFNFSSRKISKLLKEDGIERAYKDRDWLFQKRVVEGKTTREIAILSGCNLGTVWQNLKELGIEQSSSHIRTKKVLYNSDFFEKIDTEEKAYWLGFSMFDGGLSYSKGARRLKFQLQKRDKSHLELLRDTIAQGASIQDGESERIPGSGRISYYSILKIYSKKMCEDLIDLGMVPSKKKESTFPNIPVELYSHFIRGLFDADGNFYLGKNGQMNITIASSSYNIMKRVVVVFEDEFQTSISNHYKRNMLFINVGGNLKVRKIMDWLYKDSTVYLERKKESYNIALKIIDSQKI